MVATKYPRLKAEKRKILGRKVKQLRNRGILPVNLYGKKIKSQALQLGQKDFTAVYKQAGETGIVELSIGEGWTHPVLIQNVARQPVSGTFLHVDFRQVDLKEKIIAEVPIEIVGSAPAVNIGGVLVQLLNEVEVEALPADLPDKLTIDVSSLAAIDQFLTVADLNFDKTKVELKLSDPKALVVKIEPPTKEEVEVKPAAPAEEAKPAEEAGKVEGKETAKPEVKKEEKKETGKVVPAEGKPTEGKK